MTIRNGVTKTLISPANTHVLRELDRDIYPPEYVCRKMYFPDGIPPEYYSFTENEEYRRQKNHMITSQISIDIWREIAEKEEELGTGHAVRGQNAEKVL